MPTSTRSLVVGSLATLLALTGTAATVSVVEAQRHRPTVTERKAKARPPAKARARANVRQRRSPRPLGRRISPKPRIHVATEPAEVVRRLASDIRQASERSIAARGEFRVALAGGSTPRALYELIASPAFARNVAWERWHVYFTDERGVSPSSAESNYRMVREALLDRVGIPKGQIHRIEGERAPTDAARRYAAALGDERLDFVLLGMGADGHTASLFPAPSARAKGALEGTPVPPVVATQSPVAPQPRVSLSLPVLNQARHVAFLVTGEGKASMIRRVLGTTSRWATAPPAAQVRPASGELHWYLDAAAARGLGR